MTTSPKYHSLRIVFAAIFVLFNVGLPVVIASCPMMDSAKMMKASCCVDSRTANSTQTIGIQKNSSCCKTTLAATRNTNEFINVSSNLGSPQISVGLLFTPPILLHFSNARSENLRPDIALMTHDDIPVFYSTLRI